MLLLDPSLLQLQVAVRAPGIIDPWPAEPRNGSRHSVGQPPICRCTSPARPEVLNTPDQVQQRRGCASSAPCSVHHCGVEPLGHSDQSNHRQDHPRSAGAASGIGKSIGEYLTQKGYTVFGSSRKPENYPDSPFQLFQLDVRDETSVTQFVEKVLAAAGRIDVLINNVGVGITGPIEEIPESEIKGVFETNFYGPVRMIKAVLPQMRMQHSGLVINVTSIAAYMGLPYRGFYSASKSALEITTEALRMETKQFGIEMTNIAPGDFATNIAAGRYHAPLLENSPYKEAYGDTLDLMNSHVDTGKDPLEMAKAVHKIIETEHPKVRYKVGSFMQRLSVFLKNNLPGKRYEKMLMKHYKLK